MPSRVILDDADKDLAMKEGISAARGDEFIRDNGEKVAKNPVRQVSSYGSQSFELVQCDPGQTDEVLSAGSMIRPWESGEKSGAGAPCAGRDGRDSGQSIPSPSRHYTSHGKMQDVREVAGLETRVSPGHVDFGTDRLTSKNDRN